MPDFIDDDEIQVLPFGLIQKGYTYCDAHAWKRADIYLRRDDGEEIGEPAFCNGPEDRSDRAITPYAHFPFNITYHAECSCCYLGLIHTVALHNKRIREVLP